MDGQLPLRQSLNNRASTERRAENLGSPLRRLGQIVSPADDAGPDRTLRVRAAATRTIAEYCFVGCYRSGIDDELANLE